MTGKEGNGMDEKAGGGDYPVLEGMHSGVSGFPALLRAEKSTLTAMTEFQDMNTGVFRLAVISAGEGQFYKGNRSKAYRQGSVFLLVPAQESEFHEQGGTTELYRFWFRPPAGDHAFMLSLDGGVNISSAGTILQLCDKIIERWEEATPLGSLGASAAFHELCYTLLLEQARQEEPIGTLDAVRRTKAFMDEHYREPITTERLSASAHINSKYYITLFGEMYGQSPIKYLNNVRMERAKSKMVQEGASIKQISREVGFSDELYFSKKFKRFTGLSPTVYMKGQHMRIASYNYPITGQLLALQIKPFAAALDPDWTRSRDESSNVAVDYRLEDDSHNRRKVWETNERVLAGSCPDLIIGADYIQDWETTGLKQIADTRIIDWCGTDWRCQLAEIADIVSRQPLAERWLDNYEREARQTKTTVRETVGDDSILPLLITETDFILFGSRNLSDVLFGDLGLQSGMPDSHIRSIDPLELAAYNPDRIIMSVGEDSIAQARWRSLRQSELWKSLRAVRNNRVYRVPLAPWFEYSAFAHQRIIELAPALFSEL